MNFLWKTMELYTSPQTTDFVKLMVYPDHLDLLSQSRHNAINSKGLSGASTDNYYEPNMIWPIIFDNKRNEDMQSFFVSFWTEFHKLMMH